MLWFTCDKGNRLQQVWASGIPDSRFLHECKKKPIIWSILLWLCRVTGHLQTAMNRYRSTLDSFHPQLSWVLEQRNSKAQSSHKTGFFLYFSFFHTPTSSTGVCFLTPYPVLVLLDFGAPQQQLENWVGLSATALNWFVSYLKDRYHS